MESPVQQLAALADEADAKSVWPASSWDALCRLGATGWMIPREYGGQGWDSSALLEGYEQLAGACLTTCFLLSQREAACRRILGSGQTILCEELLPALARGEQFATVGLSQLTTSRQHTGPSLHVRETPTAFLFDGEIPWVTGAARAEHIVIGAALDDGRQVMAVLPTHLSGVQIGPPMELMALEGSLTTAIRCDNVELDRRWLLMGPTDQVMKSGRGGTGGLETSCLALGLAGAAVAHLEQEAHNRPDLLPTAESFRRQHGEFRTMMYRLLDPDSPPEQILALRAKANALVLSATQAALTASKGAGFLRQHPAQRWARQALFFLVWSCPRPAAAATLNQLTMAARGEPSFDGSC